MNALGALRAVWRRRRVLDAERRFFDAYSRGGTHAPRDLVIPVDYFALGEGARQVRRWIAGEPLEVRALHDAWVARTGGGNDVLFYKNLLHFLALLTGGAGTRGRESSPDVDKRPASTVAGKRGCG